MTQRIRLSTAALAGAGLGLLAGCRHTEVLVPEPDTYFPVAVGTYRAYAVTDSTWLNGTPTVKSYQQRERVTGQYQDAAGLTAYRVVRARRATAADAWVDDSVLTVQPLPRLVLQTLGNVRTVELVYPAVAGKRWNQYAFTVNNQALTYLLPDTITNRARRYAALGAYTTPASGGQAARSYDATVTTADSLNVQINDLNLKRSGRAQVFARGVGPVLRRSYYQERFVVISGGQTVPTGRTERGTAHLEVLTETGQF